MLTADKMPQLSVVGILVQSTILNALANVLAQLMYQYHNSVCPCVLVLYMEYSVQNATNTD